MRPGLDIVVTNYRTPGDLSTFLSSLKLYPPSVPYDVRVMNVDPQDPDREVVEHLEDNWEAVEFETNVGYAVASNHGASLGDREVIAIFNADVESRPDVHNICYHALLSNDRWAVLGPRQVDLRNKITCAGTFGTQDAPKMRGWKERDRGQYNDVRDDAVHVSGSAMYWRREAWAELRDCPLFQEVAPEAKGALLTTFMYYEETFAEYHAISHGWKCVYWGALTNPLIHKWHRASPVGGFADQQMKQARELFRRACDVHGIPRD